MLLRRMIEHVESQNWFAVGLDFFIVVTGVAFAFQLTTWGEERAADARAQASLVQLYEEAEEATRYFTQLVAESDQWLDNQDQVIAALNDGTIGDLDQRRAAGALYTMGFYPTISPPRRVYDELHSAGLLREIEAPDAMSAVSTYYEALVFMQGQIVFFRPEPSEQEILYPAPGIVTTYDPTNLTRLGIEIDASALVANARYMSMIANTLRNRFIFQNYRRNTMAAAAAMCAALAEAVDKECEAQADYLAIADFPDFMTRNTTSAPLTTD